MAKKKIKRFDKIDLEEPNRDATIQILLGTIPRTEYKTGIKMISNSFLRTMLMESIVDATSTYKRVYGLYLKTQYALLFGFGQPRFL